MPNTKKHNTAKWPKKESNTAPTHKSKAHSALPLGPPLHKKKNTKTKSSHPQPPPHPNRPPPPHKKTTPHLPTSPHPTPPPPPPHLDLPPYPPSGQLEACSGHLPRQAQSAGPSAGEKRRGEGALVRSQSLEAELLKDPQHLRIRGSDSLCQGLIPCPIFQPSFFSTTDRGFPWVFDGFLERMGKVALDLWGGRLNGNQPPISGNTYT